MLFCTHAADREHLCSEPTPQRWSATVIAQTRAGRYLFNGGEDATRSKGGGFPSGQPTNHNKTGERIEKGEGSEGGGCRYQ